MSMIIIAIIAIAGLLALWFASGFNRLVHLKALLDEAWSGIDVQLKRRYDLIPNLVSVVKQYSIHEKGIFEQIALARSASMNATGVEQKSHAEAGLTQALKTLFAVVENYPNLKANENFLSLQQDLNNIEQEIQLARRYYNGTARNYNIVVQRFPTNVIASLFNFQKADYFQISASGEREAPEVKF